MVNDKFDYIVIGGGINSLISAALLANKNKSVLLFESNDKVGGMASSNAFSPGFRCNLIYDYIKWIDNIVIKDLKINLYYYLSQMIKLEEWLPQMNYYLALNVI